MWKGKRDMSRVIIALAVLGTLSACGGSTDGTYVEGSKAIVNRKGNMVTGKAGPAWTDAEIASNAYGAICGPGQTVSNLQITRTEDGSAKFSATCQ